MAKFTERLTVSVCYNKEYQETQLPLRNRTSAMHFFVAKLLSTQ